jgi:hypothetical protein
MVGTWRTTGNYERRGNCFISELQALIGGSEPNRRALVLAVAKEIIVRTAAAILVLALGACNVDTDSANEQVTVEYNKQQIRKTAREAGRTAREVASGVGNVAVTTGRAIKNEVGDIDVDVDVTRNRKASEEPKQPR